MSPAGRLRAEQDVGIKAAADKIGLNFKLNVVPATGYSNYLYDPATRGDTDLLYSARARQAPPTTAPLGQLLPAPN